MTQLHISLLLVITINCQRAFMFVHCAVADQHCEDRNWKLCSTALSFARPHCENRSLTADGMMWKRIILTNCSNSTKTIQRPSKLKIVKIRNKRSLRNAKHSFSRNQGTYDQSARRANVALTNGANFLNLRTSCLMMHASLLSYFSSPTSMTENECELYNVRTLSNETKFLKIRIRWLYDAFLLWYFSFPTST